MSNHIPEPWIAEIDESPATDESDILITAMDGDVTVCDVHNHGAGSLDHDGAECRATAARIAACVNACKGIDPEAVPLMVDALRRLVREWDLGREPMANDWSEARDAIAKATA